MSSRTVDPSGSVPAWMAEAHDEMTAIPPEEPPSARLWPLAAFTAGLLTISAASGVLTWLILSSDATTAAGSPSSNATTATSTSTSTSTLPEGSSADRMAIRIETSAAAEGEIGGDQPPMATATVKEDGLVYFEGAFRSQAEATRYVTQASEVFGPDAIVEDYVIDPAAPEPGAADVALDKPVLFETGSAEIHPDYIPFLEACGDVLRLNPDITMSIAAFTDSTGSEELNLELSRLRAQAIVDFYADLDIDADQLIATGLGETIPVAGNDTAEGRQQNRRAMLELLGVMRDE